MALFKPPKIPDPVKPRDFTLGQRKYYQDIVREGDPVRQERDRAAIDRLLTNADVGVVGPTPASTLAMRNQAGRQVNEQISGYLLQSDVMEEQKREQAEGRFFELKAQRERDLDEYDQQVQATKAARAVMQSNFESGLLRAGVNLAGTIVGIPGVANFLGIGGEDVTTNPFQQGGGGGGSESEPVSSDALQTGVGLGSQDAGNYNLEGVDYGEFGSMFEPVNPESQFLGPGKGKNPEADPVFNGFDTSFLMEDYDPLDEMSTFGLF